MGVGQESADQEVMHTIEEQVVAFRIRTLRYSHDVTSNLADLIEEDIRGGWSSLRP